MYTEELDLIRAMLELSKTGKLTWAKTDYNYYEAAVVDQVFKVEFIYLARTDNGGSDRTLARLTAFQLVFDYSIGTEGMNLLCEMLAFSEPEWSEWQNRRWQRLFEGLTFLQRL